MGSRRVKISKRGHNVLASTDVSSRSYPSAPCAMSKRMQAVLRNPIASLKSPPVARCARCT